MTKKVIKRCLLGAPLGIAISTVITVFISIFIADGSYYPVMPELAKDFGGELNAVILQAVFSMLYGAAFAGASAVWEAENLSLLQQTAIHFAVCSISTLPIAYFMRWTERSLAGVAVYFAIFCAIYVAIWVIQYFAVKSKLKKMNDKLKGEN